MSRICLVLFLAAGVISGCDATKSYDKIREVSDIEVDAQKSYLETKARAAEADLERRQRFYQVVAGTYEGMVRIGQDDFRLRLTLVPSLPRYVPNDRVRTWEEVTAELSNLYFNVHIIQWNPQTNFGAVGCIITNVRPDIIKGLINVASEGCPNFYSFEIAEGSTGDTQSSSSVLAEAIADGRVESVPKVQGQMQPTTNANIYKFSAVRIQE